MRNLNFITATALLVFGFLSSSAVLAARSKELPEKLPSKLPAKAERAEVKRSRIDFTKQDTAVISVPSSRPTHDSALITQKQSSPTVVKSRVFIAAPVGDQAEPLSSFERQASSAREASLEKQAPLEKSVTNLAVVTKEIIGPIELVGPKPAPPIVLPQPAVVEMDEYHLTAKIVAPDIRRSNLSKETQPPTDNEIPIEVAQSAAIVVTNVSKPATTGFLQSVAPETISFLRAGYLNANYKKFDDRMNNSATSFGLGIARGFETTWGSFEARAALDAYHAMDQSVTVDNVRMLSVRTEVAYWLSHSRVKPGVSLGLGWADYSIRSYRSISGEDERTVTIRTHAKSRAFTVIPATSLRIELGEGLMIDTQTEFLALLGGESADAAQGLGVTVSLGWIF